MHCCHYELTDSTARRDDPEDYHQRFDSTELRSIVSISKVNYPIFIQLFYLGIDNV